MLRNPSNYETTPDSNECRRLHTYPARVENESFSVNTATIGSWSFDASEASLPGGDSVAANELQLVGQGQSARPSGNYLYLFNADPNNTQIGDHRVSYTALSPGLRTTIFAEGSGNSLVAHNHKEGSFFRALRGDRATAISTLKTEYAVAGVMGYLIGFLMMWFGLSSIFAPLHAVAGILPFLKKASSFIVSLVTFPIALVLTLLTMLISSILQSPIALAIVGVIVIGGAVYLYKNRKPGGSDDAPPGPPPGGFGPGTPPGPPPGDGGFGGMPPGAPPAGPMAATPPGPPPGGMPPGPPPA
jgi:hypothetical protein